MEPKAIIQIVTLQLHTFHSIGKRNEGKKSIELSNFI